MAEVNNFLDDSEEDIESEVSDVDIEHNDDVEMEDSDDMEQDHEMESEDEPDEDNTMTQQHVNTASNGTKSTPNSNGVVRVEDLLAKQAAADEEERKLLPSATVDHQTTLSFDLGHVCCYDPSSIDIEQLFKYKKEELPTANEHNQVRRLDQSEYEIRKLKEKYLYDLTRSNVQAMVNKLYSLPAMKRGPNDDPGIVVKLPAKRTKLPRAKPLPEALPMTRWEKFALRKGIRSSKKTKDLLQWDETTKTWKKKYGYNKANDPLDAPIYEHKDNDHDTSNPFTRMKKEKQERIRINKENQMRNLKEALGDRVSGTLDLQSAMNFSKNKKKKQIGNRAVREMEKEKNAKYGHLNVALKVAQHSTASVGKFDDLNRNEPKPEYMKNRKKAVDYMQTNENSKVHQYRHGKDSFANKERTKQNEILFNIFGKQQTDAFNQQKAVKHAQFAIQKQRINNKRNRSRKKK